MPRKDFHHDIVRAALERDGWIITHDPLVLMFGRRQLFVNLGAESPIAAEKDGREIAVEVKGLAGPSTITEFERAIGQYVLYEKLLETQEPGRKLYLAVPAAALNDWFLDPDIEALVLSLDISIMVFQETPPEVVRWIEPANTPPS